MSGWDVLGDGIYAEENFSSLEVDERVDEACESRSVRT